MLFDFLQWFGRLFTQPISGKLPPKVEKEVYPKLKMDMNEPWTHAKRKKVMKAVAASSKKQDDN
jgi:hypothetical protein